MKSGNVGYCKPEVDIFNIFLDQTKLKPEEFVFFDDTMNNIERAIELKWNAFEYNKHIAKNVQTNFWNIKGKICDQN